MEMKMKHRWASVVMTAAVAGGLLGCANDPYRSSGRVTDDRSVNSRIEKALKTSPVYKFPHVDVITYNGTVQLNGFVHRDEQKAVASEMARTVDGVREVINNITIIPAERAYGGTADPKAGVGGSGTNAPSAAPRNPNQ